MGSTNAVVIDRGDVVSDHLSSLKQYGDGKPLLAVPAGIPGKTKVMNWKVGDGILTITVAIGTDIINDISYIVRTDGGKGLPLRVKDFNPETGEMTIIIPNQELEPTSLDAD